MLDKPLNIRLAFCCKVNPKGRRTFQYHLTNNEYESNKELLNTTYLHGFQIVKVTPCPIHAHKTILTLSK